MAELLKFVDDGYEVYDPVAARECVNSWRAAQQSCSLRAFDLAGPMSTCEHLIGGTEPLGAPCNTELDCAPPATNCVGLTPSDAHCEASAVALKHGRAGDECMNSCTTPCFALDFPSSIPIPTVCYEADGLGCTAAHVCKPLAQVGEPCTDANCVSDARCESGTCVPGTNTSIATPHACGAEP